ncbi:Glutathione S-transferase T1 [Sesamum angolense]|uniref:Glutathione S-transferase T1 n=1 Tax=Sesamum angolense TaxID=2727404 RepID=A0AAE1WXC4_9LAMI|nr:Glutathione S-transferase T1 [Sesamum angolense]
MQKYIRIGKCSEIDPTSSAKRKGREEDKVPKDHAILIYLASAFPGVADHWYPADVQKRAKIHSVLDWHHSNLRSGSLGYHFNTGIALAYGLPLDPKAAAEGEKLLSASLATIESLWLEDDRPFLLGNAQPSIADISLVCEIIQLEKEFECEEYGRRLHNKTYAPYFGDIHVLPSRDGLIQRVRFSGN